MSIPLVSAPLWQSEDVLALSFEGKTEGGAKKKKKSHKESHFPMSSDPPCCSFGTRSG